MSQERNSPRPSYGTFREKLTLEDIEGKVAVLTVASTDLKNMAPRDSTKEDWKIAMTFEEFPEEGDEHEREYVVNSTSYKTLCMKLGTDNHAQWIGRAVVVGPVENEFDGKKFRKVHVVAPDVWDKAMASHAKARKGR